MAPVVPSKGRLPAPSLSAIYRERTPQSGSTSVFLSVNCSMVYLFAFWPNRPRRSEQGNELGRNRERPSSTQLMYGQEHGYMD